MLRIGRLDGQWWVLVVDPESMLVVEWEAGPFYTYEEADNAITDNAIAARLLTYCAVDAITISV